MKKIIEVTGVAGVGKSFIIERLLQQNPNTIVDSELIKRYKLNDLALFRRFFKLKNSFDNLVTILKISMLLNMGLFDRLNFIRNSIKKLGKYYFLKYEFDEDRIVLVDEGVSHLYQNVVSPKPQNDRKITQLIDRLLFSINFALDIIVVDAPFETIYNRLKIRGHKRVNSRNIVPFIRKSKEQLSKLKRRFPKIVEISNIDNVNSPIEEKSYGF